MRVHFFTAALLLSLASLSITKVEADISPTVPLEAIDAFIAGVETGKLWENPPLDAFSMAQQSMALVNTLPDAVDTAEGLKDVLSPVLSINHAAAGVALNQPMTRWLDKPANVFVSAPLIASIDPANEFSRQLREGLFIRTADRGPTAHKLFSIMNNHGLTAPNPYGMLTKQTGLGGLDNLFSVTSFGAQLPALDPDNTLPRLIKFMPEITIAPDNREAQNGIARVLQFFKTNLIGIMMPEDLFGAEG